MKIAAKAERRKVGIFHCRPKSKQKVANQSQTIIAAVTATTIMQRTNATTVIRRS